MQPGLSYWIPSSITPYYCHWGYEHPSIWPKNHPHVHKCTTQEWENGGARNDDFWLLCLGPWGYLIRAGLAPNGNFPEQYNIPQPSPATCVASLLWQIGPELVGEFIFFRSVVYFLFCNCPCYLQHFEAGSCERYLQHFRVRTCHFPWHFAAPTVHVGWYFATRVHLIRVGLGFIWGWFGAWFRVGFRGVWTLLRVSLRVFWRWFEGWFWAFSGWFRVYIFRLV